MAAAGKAGPQSFGAVGALVIGDANRGTGAREPSHRRRSDAAAPARDQGDLALENRLRHSIVSARLDAAARNIVGRTFPTAIKEVSRRADIDHRLAI